MSKQKPDPVWPLRKRYWSIHNNFYGCLKKALLSDNEKKIMEGELRRAEHELQEAEEQENSRG